MLYHESSILYTMNRVTKKIDKSTKGGRIRYIRESVGLSQAALGKACGVTKSAVSQWELGTTGNLKNDALYALGKATGYSPEWIATGEGEEKPSKTNKASEAGNVDDVTAAGRPIGIPLISWVQAGEWCNAEDPYTVGDYEDIVPVAGKYSDSAFVLRVRGDSMESQSGISFPEGSLIIVDPEKSADNGAYVIARLQETKEVTFKQLVIDAGKTYLKPLNPRYPIIEIQESTEICGVVCGMTYLIS